MKTEIEFLRITPDNVNQHLPSLIACYRSVYSTEPWREWLFCPNCERKWGEEDAGELCKNQFHCPDCRLLLSDFWASSKVGNDLLHEINYPHISFWIALSENAVVGFTHGYGISPQNLESKLKLPGVAEAINKRFNFPELVIYQDELGVVKEFRGAKIARQLVLRRLNDFMASGLTCGIIRTMSDPPSVTFSWYTEKLNYYVIAEYHDKGKRVVLAQDLRDVARRLEV